MIKIFFLKIEIHLSIHLFSWFFVGKLKSYNLLELDETQKDVLSNKKKNFSGSTGFSFVNDVQYMIENKKNA